MQDGEGRRAGAVELGSFRPDGMAYSMHRQWRRDTFGLSIGWKMVDPKAWVEDGQDSQVQEGRLRVGGLVRLVI